MAPAGGPRAKKGILERLDSGEVVVGDGSFLITLEKRGFVKAGLWTPEAVVEHPSAVRQLHTEFLRAGADVLQTFTFSATEDNMESKWEAVNAAACDLAREVADGGDALVAGGLCQTSLYKYHKDETRIKNLFRRQLEVFVRKNVDFLIAEYFEHVEEAVWAVEVLREVGKPVAATMCIGPEGDMHDVTPGECAVKLARAGANIIGVNCRFGPWTSLQTIKLMKEGLRDSGLQAHLMVQSLGFHTPDCGKGGFVDLPEYPFSMEPRVATRWDIQKYTREAYNLGVRYIGGCCGFEPYHIRAIAEELAPERGFLPPASEKHGSWGSGLNMHTKPWIRARYKVNTLACPKTASLGSRKSRLDGNTGRICCQLQAGLSVLRSQSRMHKKQRKKTLKRQPRKNRSQALSSLLLSSACLVFQLLSIDELLSLQFKQHIPPEQTRQMLWRCGGS